MIKQFDSFDLSVRQDEISNFLLIDGLVAIKNFITLAECREYLLLCLDIEKRFAEEGGQLAYNGTVISHPFTYNRRFLQLSCNKYIHGIIKRSIGDSPILVNSNINNRQINFNGIEVSAPGASWHTDSRYIQQGKVRIGHSFGYQFCVCISDFNVKNGATQFIEKSHLDTTRPSRELDETLYQFKTIELNAGDAFIFDTGLWHRSGPPGNSPRWSCFNFYGPWYFKPYFNYSRMFSSEDIKNFDDTTLDLLHFTSEPPVFQVPRSKTLLTPDEFRKEKAFGDKI